MLAIGFGFNLLIHTRFRAMSNVVFPTVWPRPPADVDDGAVQRGGRAAQCGVGCAAGLRPPHVHVPVHARDTALS